MEIILKEDIKGLGYKNDLVKVRPGYGRNFLIPQGKAFLATISAKKELAENVRQAAHKAEKVKKDALETAAKMKDLTLKLTARVGESGKIFGAVTALQVSDALEAQGIVVDRKRIVFKADVKELGTYSASIDLHKEVKVELKVEVVAE
jgi:large subunit ribosomal protein L9